MSGCSTCLFYVYAGDNRDADGYCKRLKEETDMMRTCRYYAPNKDKVQGGKNE